MHVEKAGGQTNRNFIVTSDHEKFFVRIPWERSDIVNRNIEGRNILALSKNEKVSSIIPKCQVYVLGKRDILDSESHEFDLPDGPMVTSYIEGKQLDGDTLRDKSIQNALVESLHTFHTSGVNLKMSMMFWRGAVRYFSVESQDEKVYFRKYVQDRTQGIQDLDTHLRRRRSPPER